MVTKMAGVLFRSFIVRSSLILQAGFSTIRYVEGVNAFSTAFTRGLPHGIAVAVHLPTSSDEIPEAVLHRLHADERMYAQELNGKRRNEWVGGRLAARSAARALGVELPALLADNFGAPKAPKSISISIAHKEGLAVALIARRANGIIGLDFETLGRDRRQIAEKVLVPAEQAEVSALPDERQWTAILLRFAIKEAIYKALAPRLRRYISFDEAEVSDLSNGSASVKLNLKGDMCPTHIEARYDWMPEGLVTSVRVRWE